jgi:hypothetical protein
MDSFFFFLFSFLFLLFPFFFSRFYVLLSHFLFLPLSLFLCFSVSRYFATLPFICGRDEDTGNCVTVPERD